MRAAIRQDETRRLTALHSLDLLDTPPDERFERIARIAREVAHTPMAVVSLVDVYREWFKTRIGPLPEELDREVSFGAHAILDTEPMIIEDASVDLRFFDNPIVRFEPKVRFYAACPIHSPGGLPLGTLAVADTEARQLDESELAALVDVAGLAEREIGVLSLASLDEPTGFLTRRGLSFLARHALQRAERDGEAISLVTVELLGHDVLRRQFGASAGDAALVEVADTLRLTLRGSDVPARLRGPMFAVLLPGTERNEAAAVAARIAEELTERDKNGIRPYGLEVHIAQATLDPNAETFTLDALLAQADSGS